MMQAPGPEATGPVDPETTELLAARLEAAAQTRLGRSLDSVTSTPVAATAANWNCAR